MTIRMQQRRDSAANWTGSPVILASGEIGVETDTGKIKVGNGADVWTALPYSTLSEFKTSAAWGSYAPVIALGKICFDSDSQFFKVGDGTSTWSELDYFKPASAILGDVSASYDTLAELEDAIVAVNTLLNSGTANQIFVTPSPDGTPVWSNSISNVNHVTLDTTPTSVPNTAGTISWDSDDAIPKVTLNTNVTIGIGQESILLVKNATGSTLAKGSVVYINGAQGQNPTVALADADTEATSSKTFGFVAEQILDGAEGYVITEGILRGVNTAGFTEGGAIWLSSTAGQYTQTVPAKPAHSVFLGYAVKAHASSGEIIIKIQNGYELEELHNVTISTPANNNILVYDNTTDPANPIWKNTNNATLNQIIVTDGSAATLGNPKGFVIGNTASTHILVDPDSVQAANSSAAANLFINPEGGNVTIASSGATIDLAGTIATGNIIAAGTATAGTAPLQFTSGTSLTVPVAGAVEYDGTVPYITPNTSFGRAPIATPIFTSGVGVSGIALTTNYALFPAANDTITLPVGTYRYEISFALQVATSTTGSTLSFNPRGTSGTAIGTFTYDGHGTVGTTGSPSGTSTQYWYATNTLAGTASTSAGSLIVAPTSAAAGRLYIVRGGGILRITTAGSIIPSYQFATSPTSGVVTLYLENHMKITPLTASGNAASTGAWA
jgi:hypothetical protein